MKRLVIGILAHVDAGKTTLSEGMLYRAGETSRLPASVRETLIESYGLDQPLTTQFATYLKNVLH